MSTGLPPELQALAYALSVKTDADSADRLSQFGWPSEKHKRLFSYVSQGLEGHARMANYGAKTWSGAAFAVACAQGRDSLDGVRIPVARVPNVGAVVVRDYGQQVDSSQAAIFQWLGDWPHEVSWINKGLGYAGTIRVKPVNWPNDNPELWSRIVFVSQENADKALGARWDWAWGDEPPHESIWREVRKNCRHLWITETPLKRSEWEWLQRDFEGTLWNPVGGRVEGNASLYDNRFLSADEVRRLEERYKGDPFIKARLYGDYVDAEGASPWGTDGYEALAEMKSEAKPGEPWAYDRRVEIWRPYEPGKHYRFSIDPSAGIRPDSTTGERGGDRGGLWGVCIEDRCGVARIYDWLSVPAMGRVALALAREYGDAQLVPEMNGGWGEGLLAEWGDYRNVWREQQLDNVFRPVSRRKGWWTDETSRGVIVSALQRALIDRSLSIPSLPAIDALMGIRLDSNGKLIRTPGQNWEDMICLGIQAHLLQSVKPVRRDPPRDFVADRPRLVNESVVPIPIRPPWLDVRRTPRRTQDAEPL